METVPVAAFVPDQFELAGVAEAVQEVGLLVADQVRAEAIPEGTEVGLAARMTVGTGAVAVNVAVTLLLLKFGDDTVQVPVVLVQSPLQSEKV